MRRAEGDAGLSVWSMTDCEESELGSSAEPAVAGAELTESAGEMVEMALVISKTGRSSPRSKRWRGKGGMETLFALLLVVMKVEGGLGLLAETNPIIWASGGEGARRLANLVGETDSGTVLSEMSMRETERREVSGE